MEISCAILQTAPLSVRARVCLCQRQYKDLITLQHNLRYNCSAILDHTATQSQITLQHNPRSHCSTILDQLAAQSQITLQHNLRLLCSTISDHVAAQSQITLQHNLRSRLPPSLLINICNLKLITLIMRDNNHNKYFQFVFIRSIQHLVSQRKLNLKILENEINQLCNPSLLIHKFFHSRVKFKINVEP